MLLNKNDPHGILPCSCTFVCPSLASRTIPLVDKNAKLSKSPIIDKREKEGEGEERGERREFEAQKTLSPFLHETA